MADVAQLMTAYSTELMANPSVRELMKTVVQDPQTETQDNAASKQALVALVTDRPELLNEPRRAIMGWLNQCYFLSVDGKFWFEMHTRMAKLLTVAIVLEGLNLRTVLGVEKPSTDDIPTAIIHLYSELVEYRHTHLDFDRQAYRLCFENPAVATFAALY